VLRSLLHAPATLLPRNGRRSAPKQINMFRKTEKSCRQTSPGQIRPQTVPAVLVKLISHIISSRTFNQPQYKRSYLHISGTLNFTASAHYCSLPVYTAVISPLLFLYPTANPHIPSTKLAITLASFTTQPHTVAELYKMNNIRGFQELSQLSRGSKFFPK